MSTLLLTRSDITALLPMRECIVAVEAAFLAHAMGGDLRPGTFVAAVGADWDTKQELAPEVLVRATVVADILEQCALIGDLHHAIVAGVMTTADVHAELADVVAGRKPGRKSPDDIKVFDSTGTALEDVAAAAAVYERAVATDRGASVDLTA